MDYKRNVGGKPSINLKIKVKSVCIARKKKNWQLPDAKCEATVERYSDFDILGTERLALYSVGQKRNTLGQPR